MEQKRLLMAIGLSFLVFFLWSITFGPKPTQQVPVSEEARESGSAAPSQGGASQSTIADARSAVPPAMPPAAEPKDESVAARTIVVDTPLFRMKLSEKGGAVVSMVLKEYQETVAVDSANKELVAREIASGTVLSSLSAYDPDLLRRGIYKAQIAKDHVVIDQAPQAVLFRYDLGNGISIDKRYRFVPESYVIDLDVTVHNGSGLPVNTALQIALHDVVDKDSGAYGFVGPSGLINNSLTQVKIKNIEENSEVGGSLRWIATERLYFITSVMSKESIEGRMLLDVNDNIVENQMVTNSQTLPAGERHEWRFSLFMGPKSLTLLKSVGNDLDRAIDFGWVDIIAKPCLWFMNFIYRYIPNYGIAIIILTIVTRLLFWPLANKSYKSMNDMRKLQPLMQEIREKYKNDKARLNQETMALYRTYKINPVGGCLPMLIQLPVFFALYRMLYQSVELRHAPFFGWINDLSAPDRLFSFSFKIPFMEAPYGIPVLTLIMGATMLLQQKMSPAPGDPMQAKMMMLMPIVFTFIFINFPSGLVLYWLISNLVSISQQYYTMKKVA